MCALGYTTQIHHITFRSQGGPDEEWNLITLCGSCHGWAHGLRPDRGQLQGWYLYLILLLHLPPGGLIPGHIKSQPVCFSCQRYSQDGYCQLWEEHYAWDYVCNNWKMRNPW